MVDEAPALLLDFHLTDKDRPLRGAPGIQDCDESLQPKGRSTSNKTPSSKEQCLSLREGQLQILYLHKSHFPLLLLRTAMLPLHPVQRDCACPGGWSRFTGTLRGSACSGDCLNSQGPRLLPGDPGWVTDTENSFLLRTGVL